MSSQQAAKQTSELLDCDRPSLKLGERIVWLSDSGPEYGHVKWLGKLPDLGSEWMAGVEFDNPVGSGTGLYKDKQLFYTPINHASLVPIIGLLKASDFDGTGGGGGGGGPPRPPDRSSSVKLIDITDGYPSSDNNHYTKNLRNNSKTLNSASGPPRSVVYNQQPPSYQQPASSSPTGLYGRYPEMTTSRVRNIPIRLEGEPDDDFHHHEDDREELVGRKVLNHQQQFPTFNSAAKNKTTTLLNSNKTIYQSPTSSPIGDLTANLGKTKLSSTPTSTSTSKDEPFSLARINSQTSAQPASSTNGVALLPAPPLDVATNEKNASLVLKNYLGKSRGIQGHNNSCYLDATLFAMFTTTTLFDSLLYRPANKNDIPEYEEIQKILREDIVRPLRKDFIVNADQVMLFRTLLEQSSSVEGLTDEEKDPEEFLSLLLSQILKAEPYLKLSSGLESFFYQLIVDKDESVVLPTVQDLFEQSFMKDYVRLREIPPCLLLQMPRFGRQYKMYSKIMPTLKLDITDVLEAAPRPCGHRGKDCDNIARFECKDCFGDRSGRSGTRLSSITYCNNCFQAKHFGKSHSTGIEDHDKTKTILDKTPPEAISRYSKGSSKDKEIARVYMDLFAVLCIETSHYVCFVKCGQNPEAPWCFFDSMADRQGEQNGYNIPEVSLFDEFGFWTSDKGLPYLLNQKDPKLLPEMARRLICDAYLCFYQYPGLTTYR